MLTRLWLVLSGGWAFVFLANGATKRDGPGAGDWFIALAPLLGALAIARAFLFVAHGSVSPAGPGGPKPRDAGPAAPLQPVSRAEESGSPPLPLRPYLLHSRSDRS